MEMEMKMTTNTDRLFAHLAHIYNIGGVDILNKIENENDKKHTKGNAGKAGN
jgi:hypothetical protein